MDIVSKAIDKWKRDGVLSLISVGAPWVYKRVTKNATRRIRYTVCRRYNDFQYEKVKDPYRFTYIDPNDVEYYLMQSRLTSTNPMKAKDVPLHKLEKGRFNPITHTGLVLPGDWDIYKKSYKFDRVFEGLKHHYQRGVPWEETEYMQTYLLRSTIRNEEGYLEKQIEAKESLYDSIKEDGFQTQYELGEKKSDTPINVPPQEITVNVGSDGELIFNNTAHHRLAISKLLGIDSIPVLIVVRHKQWQKIRKEVREAEIYDELSEKAKNHVNHPDLQELVDEDWP